MEPQIAGKPAGGSNLSVSNFSSVTVEELLKIAGVALSLLSMLLCNIHY